jgi:NitT/TauT family transport system substrate-binding protein
VIGDNTYHPLRRERRQCAAVLTLFLAFVVICEAIPAGSTAAAAQDEPIPVTLATGFVPNVQFAPYYLAQDRGYYADEGLAVTIQNGANANVLTQVGAGAIDFAITGGDALVPARVAGGPLNLRYGPVSEIPCRRHGH